MDPNIRTMVLAAGLVFCLAFAAMTLTVAVEFGVDVFTLASVAILVMLMLALIGALRNPPD